jgi:opacity protein-like surface antigen
VTEQDFPGPGDTYTLDKANLNILSGGVHGKYFIPVGEGGKVAPFLLAGVGMYNAKEDYQETIVSGGSTTVFTDESDGVESESRFGYKFGAGGTYMASEKVGISLQGDYNIVTLDTAGAPAGAPSTFNFFTVRVGVNYHIMK